MLTRGNLGHSAVSLVSPLTPSMLSPRNDEPPSHPHQRAGRAHRAAESQRQPETLPGVRGEKYIIIPYE